MGVYLSQPNKEKDSKEYNEGNLRFAYCSMQGSIYQFWSFLKNKKIF
jgi:hypothetical protein